VSLVPGGALGQLGINPLPQGTLAELAREGLDPGLVTSCSPTRPGIRACPVEADCPFHLKRYGGFKFVRGPRNVGYYLATDGAQKEDWCACHVYVRTLLARQRQGNALREQGKPHERIAIIAQEGEEILTNVVVPKNPEAPEHLREYHSVQATVRVPAHPRPGENKAMTHAHELARRQAARDAADPMYDAPAAPAPPPRLDPSAPVTPWEPAPAAEAPEPEPAATATATAEPVRRKHRATAPAPPEEPEVG
jgi:hypothetical protein